MRIISWALVMLAFFLWSYSVEADTIHLKDGRVVNGKIISEDGEVVKIKEQFGSGYVESDYLISDIEQIERGSEDLDAGIVSKKEGQDHLVDDGEDWTAKTGLGIEYKAKRQNQKEFDIAKFFAEGADAKEVERIIVLSTTPIIGMVFATQEACDKMASDPLFRKKTLEKWHGSFLTSKSQAGEDVGGDEQLAVVCGSTEVAVIKGGLLGTRILWKL